jgi:hypothetical protein
VLRFSLRHTALHDDLHLVRTLEYFPVVRWLLAAHCLNGISPFNRLPAECLSDAGGGGISTLDACVLGLEMEKEVGLAITIGILDVASSVHFFCVGAKLHTQGVEGDSIQGVRCQDGYGDDAFPFRVDVVPKVAGLEINVDVDTTFRRVSQFVLGYRDHFIHSISIYVCNHEVSEPSVIIIWTHCP